MKTGTPRGARYRHHHTTMVAAAIEDAFGFLVDPARAPLLEPPWTEMRFVPGPARDLGLGSEREYVFRLSGSPMYLRILVAELVRPRRLVFEQALGPWQSLRRAFSLRDVAGATAIEVRTEVSSMPGVVDRAVHHLVGAPHLRAIDAFRHQALLRHLGDPSLTGETRRG